MQHSLPKMNSRTGGGPKSHAGLGHNRQPCNPGYATEVLREEPKASITSRAAG